MKCPKNKQCPKKPANSLDHLSDKRPFCKKCDGKKKDAKYEKNKKEI